MISVDRVTEFSIDLKETVQALAGHSFYRSVAFAHLWDTEGGTPIFWLVKSDDIVVGFLPGVEFGIGPLKRFQSMPNGCYGGLVIDSNSLGDIAQIKEKLSQALIAYPYARVIINDFYSSFDKDELPGAKTEETMIANITDSEWKTHDSIMRGYEKAIREGITVVDFDFEHHFDLFLKLMTETEKRHDQKQKYSDLFFQKLAHLAKSNKQIIWKWCEHEGSAVASHIYFMEYDSLIYWQGYFDKKYSSLHPNQFMLYSMGKWGQQNGLKTFNLGSSPDEAEGLRSFKKRLGGQNFSYQVFDMKKGLGKFF